MTYETKIKKIDEIVSHLNDDSLTLDESLNYYNEGLKLAKEALDDLKTYKRKIELFNKDLSELEVEIEVQDDNSDE